MIGFLPILCPDEDRAAIHLRAKAAEKAERYDEMAFCMRLLARRWLQVTLEEIDMLFAAYRNIVREWRSSWWEEAKKPRLSPRWQTTREKLSRDIHNAVSEVHGLVDLLLDRSLAPPHRVTLYRVKGDFYRFSCEIDTGADLKHVIESAHEAYESGKELAFTLLLPTSPVRLGLMLSYCTFTAEILNDAETACNMVNSAYDDALQNLDELNEENYRDTSLLMQLLHGCRGVWTSDIDSPKADEEPMYPLKLP